MVKAVDANNCIISGTSTIVIWVNK
jgi:hypothetical protein